MHSVLYTRGKKTQPTIAKKANGGRGGTYVIELVELSFPELRQCVGAILVDLAQTHLTDAVTHLTHIQQGRSQGLQKYAR